MLPKYGVKLVKHVQFIQFKEYSQLSRKRTPSRELKKSPSVELSAFENYSQKRTPKKKNPRVDVRLQESQLVGVIMFQLGSQK